MYPAPWPYSQQVPFLHDHAQVRNSIRMAEDHVSIFLVQGTIDGAQHNIHSLFRHEPIGC